MSVEEVVADRSEATGEFYSGSVFVCYFYFEPENQKWEWTDKLW